MVVVVVFDYRGRLNDRIYVHLANAWQIRIVLRSLGSKLHFFPLYQDFI